MHQAIELLLKRMESNPEEFVHATKNRWKHIIKRYEHLFSEEENAVIKTKLREIEFGEFHKELMAELLYGEERRLEEAEAIEEKRMEMLRLQSARGALMQSTHRMQAAQGLQNSLTSSTNGSSYATQLHIGGETIDGSLVKKLKALLTKEST